MESEAPTYQLYAYPNTYSIGVHLLLEEAGVPYTIINPRLNPAQTDTNFYRASPHGRVPALVLPNGTTFCESGAIALHLADTLCGQKFAVSAESADRVRYLQWLFYLSSTLQPEVMIVFHPEHYFTDTDRQTELTDAAVHRLTQVWAVLEREYKNNNGPWMFADGPTAVDFALTTVLVWPECFSASAHDYPSLCAMLEAMSARTSCQRILPWHRGENSQPPQRTLQHDTAAG